MFTHHHKRKTILCWREVMLRRVECWEKQTHLRKTHSHHINQFRWSTQNIILIYGPSLYCLRSIIMKRSVAWKRKMWELGELCAKHQKPSFDRALFLDSSIRQKVRYTTNYHLASFKIILVDRKLRVLSFSQPKSPQFSSWSGKCGDKSACCASY